MYATLYCWQEEEDVKITPLLYDVLLFTESLKVDWRGRFPSEYWRYGQKVSELVI